jgi:hypothetical protein
VLAGLLGLGLSACAMHDAGNTMPARAVTPYPPPGYSHMVRTSDVALYWNCTRPDPALLQIDGVAFSPWATQPVRFLELDVVGVDARGRTLSEAATHAPDIQLFTNQSTEFQLTLRTTGGETRVDLFYRYQFQEDGDDRLEASLAWDGPIRLAQAQKQFMVRDACAETQHRVR